MSVFDVAQTRMFVLRKIFYMNFFIMKINIWTLTFVLMSISLFAQQTPAKKQVNSILILNAKAHLGTGKVIENSAIGFADGKITFVADARITPPNTSEWDKVIDAKGKEIYPGFIAPNSQIGLKEIDAVRATRDNREVGGFNPNIRAIIAYNTDSRVTPTIRANGILMAQVVPEGGRVPGSSSIVELDAWNWEDAAYKMDDGIHLHWPSMHRRTGWWAAPGPTKKNDDYQKQITEIKQHFQAAKAYARSTPSSKNLKFEAMREIFSANKKLFIHTNEAKAMLEVIQFIKDMDVQGVIIGAKDAWLIADELANSNIPVILTNTQSLPSNIDDDIDQPFKTPKILHDKGVLFALSMEGAWEQFNLAFQAGQAVSYGLPYEQAIKALTANTAKILGIDDSVGTLETGKDATFFIAAGDILDMRTAKVEQAFIGGKSIDLDNKFKTLARKFRGKYSAER